LSRVRKAAKDIARGLDLAFARLMKKPRKEAAVGWKVYIYRKKLTWLGTVEAKRTATRR
jgi:hypothetical protein